MSEKIYQNEEIQDQPLGEAVSQSQPSGQGQSILGNQTTPETPLPQNKVKVAGELVGVKLDTVSKKILSDFNFGTTDYAGAVKAGSVDWNPATGAILSGDGVVVYRKGIVGVKNGVVTFFIDAETGDVSFAGAITGGTITIGSNFSVDSSGNMQAVSGKYVESLPVGEAISDGNVVCLKPAYVDLYPTADTYIYDQDPTSSFGTADRMYVGGILVGGQNKFYFGLMKFDLSLIGAVNVLSAELHLEVSNYHVNSQLALQRITSAWSESTTYNTRPTMVDDIDGYFTTKQYNITGSTTWLNIDLTQLLRAGVLNNGIALTGSGPDNWFGFFSKETTPTDRPYLRVWLDNHSDGRVYKADSTDYYKSRCIVGIAQGSQSTVGANVLVQTHGKIGNISFQVTGGKFYLGTNGGVTLDPTGFTRIIPLGKVIPSGAVIDIQDQGVSLETKYFGTSLINKTYYIPSDCRMVVVEYDRDNGSTQRCHTATLFRGQTVMAGQPGGFVYPTITFGVNYISWTNVIVNNIYLYT